MLTHVIALNHYLKILRSVVVYIAVDVVHDLVAAQRPPEFLLGHYAVLVASVEFSVGLAITAVALNVAALLSRLARDCRVVVRRIHCCQSAPARAEALQRIFARRLESRIATNAALRFRR